MPTPSGLYGAMFDPDATQPLGALSTGIGAGINAVYGPPIAAGLSLGDNMHIARIGSPPPYGASCKSVDYPASVTTFQNATVAAVPPAGAMPGGGFNRTGQTVPINGACYAPS